MLSRFVNLFRSCKTGHARKHPPARLQVEVLEDRFMPAVTTLLANEVLTIRSDSAADTITVAADAATNRIRVFNTVGTLIFDQAVVVPGPNSPQTVFRQIRVEGGGGNDTLIVAGTINTADLRTNVTVDGQVENVTLGNNVTGGRTVLEIRSDVALEGASNLTVDASADSVTGVIINSGNLTVNGAFNVNYTSSMLSMIVRTGAGADEINMNGVAAPTQIETNGGADTIKISGTGGTVSVNAGAGADAIVLGNTFLYHNMNGLSSSLITLQGGTGTGVDTLTLEDSGASVNSSTNTVTATSITRSNVISQPGGGTQTLTVNVNVSGLETIDFFTAPGVFSQVAVRGTAAGTTTRIHAGTSNPVSVGDTANRLSGILGALEVIGATDATHAALILRDEGMTTNQTYAISSTSLSRPGIATITFSNLRSFGLTAGSGHDTFNVNSIPTTSQSDPSIYGSAGSDTVRGTAQANDFIITGAERGSLNVGGRRLNFESMNGLAGGSADDRFVFANNAAFVYVNGQGGVDIADFSARTSGVTVDLTNKVATLGGSSLRAVNLEIVFGSSVADTLIGSTAAEVFVGNGGDDTIEGRGGLDILIGGSGSDTLRAGSASTILIGHSTLNDTDPNAMIALAKVWQTTNISYDKKVALLVDAPDGLLRVARHTRDNTLDFLFGNTAQDFFFSDAPDVFGGTLPQSNEKWVVI